MTVTVKMLETRAAAQGSFYSKDNFYQLDNATAALFISHNWAVLTSGKLVDGDGIPALLSADADGNHIEIVNPKGGKLNYASVKERVIASYPQGANYRLGKSLFPATTWASGQSVLSGSICKNSVGNLYQSCTTTTTGVGSEPVHTAQPLGVGADGIRWVYLGKADTAYSADLSNTPVITYATVPASCTKYINPNDSITSNAYWLGGSDITEVSPFGGPFGVGPLNYTNSIFLDFVTDAPIIGFNQAQNWVSGTRTPEIVNIEGIPLYPFDSRPYINTTTVIPNGCTVFDFSLLPTKPRRFRVPFSNANGTTGFTGMFIPPQYSVWKPENPNRYRMCFEGDSFMQGGDSGNGITPVSHQIAMRLGCDDLYDTSVGSSGYMKPNGTSTRISRIPKVIAAKPDILFLGPTSWDESGYTTQERRYAYNSYFNQIFAALPDIIILTCGNHGVGSNTNIDMQYVVNNYGHPHLVYIDVIGDGVTTVTQGVGISVLSGNGDASTVQTETVVGNSKWVTGGSPSDTHPNARGKQVLSTRFANLIYKAILSIT